jgi:hypothetical protein
VSCPWKDADAPPIVVASSPATMAAVSTWFRNLMDPPVETGANEEGK